MHSGINASLYYSNDPVVRQTGGMNVDIDSQLIGLPQTKTKILYEQLRPLYIRMARDELPTPVVTVPYYDDFAKGELTSTAFHIVRCCALLARQALFV